MHEKLTGKIIIKHPFICECCIKIDGRYKILNPFKKNTNYKIIIR